jgi:hypothetical protein
MKKRNTPAPGQVAESARNIIAVDFTRRQKPAPPAVSDGVLYDLPPAGSHAIVRDRIPGPGSGVLRIRCEGEPPTMVINTPALAMKAWKATVETLPHFVIAGMGYGFTVMHNHPSGEPLPSESDKKFTRRLREAADLLQVQMVDHVIVGRGKCYSFAGNGLM